MKSQQNDSYQLAIIKYDAWYQQLTNFDQAVSARISNIH